MSKMIFICAIVVFCYFSSQPYTCNPKKPWTCFCGFAGIEGHCNYGEVCFWNKSSNSWACCQAGKWKNGVCDGAITG